MKELIIKTRVLSNWQINTYVIQKKGGTDCFVIDAGPNPTELIEEVKKMQLRPKMLIYTHAHLDHIAGAKEIIQNFPEIKTAISKDEASFLEDPVKNMSFSLGERITAPAADVLLTDGDVVSLDGLDFIIIATPGHSPGGICIYQKDEAVLFSGDTLFEGSIGRYDFPSSDGEKLLNSIKNKLLVLPEDTEVFPGHGGRTTIKKEKNYNPFLK